MELEGRALIHSLNLKYSLFLRRRFLPIFLATFLGTFNDNLLRSGLVVLIAYSASHGIVLLTRPEILVTLCSALLVIPMLLFSSLAGMLADKYEKSRLVQIAKLAEVVIMMVGCYGFATRNIALMMSLLFVSGAHTTFYTPIKFSILPDHLKSGELLAGNGFMAAGSYLAVLGGLITGGLLVELPDNAIGIAAIAIALTGLLASLFLPPSSIAHPESKISFRLFKSSKEIVRYAGRDRKVLLSLLGLSWFLLIGSVYMAQFPNYAQGVVRGDNQVYILFLTVFSIGIALGSLLCDTLLKGQVSLRLMPYAALGISLFTYLMVLFTPRESAGALMDASTFLAVKLHWRVLFCMMMVALSGGVYIVPLYAVLQAHTQAQYRSRIMAAGSLSDSVFVTLGALACAALLSLGWQVTDLFLLVATLNLPVAWYSRNIGDEKR